MRRILAVFAMLLLAPCVRAAERTLLHPLFSDHAVLQRDRPIRVYGDAEPHETVTVMFAGRTSRARADAHGQWQATLPALPAGGPYRLVAEASGGATQGIEDVLVGDVWLCSGQSNMELPVRRTLDADGEIAASANPRIRMLTVGQTSSVTPLAAFATPTAWKPAAPDSTGGFSATCYYFARELQKTVDVPMGLVNASWGGSRIQAWIGAGALQRLGDYDADLDVLAQYARDPVAAAAGWGELWANWWRTRPGVAAGDEPWSPDGADAGWRAAPGRLGAWEHWGVPELAGFNGLVWYRTPVELTAAQAAQQATLVLGPADEIDMTWVNGRGVGSSYGWDAPREYALPRGLLHAGTNLVVVGVLDTWKDGGLIGPAPALRFADGSSVPLRDWGWRMAPKAADAAPRAPWQSASGLTVLHNGMIAPMRGYGLRGVVWYQGESNTQDAARYADLLGALIGGWRAQFGANLPVLNVQLAGFGPAPTHPGESDWAALREAQRRYGERDARYGYACAIDIGERDDIHPPNKQALGRRLARLARHLEYGEPGLPPSGPVPVSATRAGDAVAVKFTDITDGLFAHGADGPIGFELCGSEANTCRYASATISGDTVLLRAPNGASATRVRHGWADSPVVTLYDGAGMPAGPFALGIE